MEFDECFYSDIPQVLSIVVKCMRTHDMKCSQFVLCTTNGIVQVNCTILSPNLRNVGFIVHS